MITIDKRRLRFLLSGRPVQLDVTRHYKPGRDYAVAQPGKRSSTCRALILDITEIEPTAWRITIRHATQESPRFLAARLGGAAGDYTDRPDLAAFGEPEALSDADLERYASTARWRDDLERRQLAHRARTQGRRSVCPTGL